MSGQLGELVVSLSADIAKFREDLGKANKISQDSARSISGHLDQIGAAATKTAGLIAGIGGAASLGALVKSAIDTADNMSKMSQKVGINIEQLTAMAHAAELADVSTEELAKSMGKLNKAMYEAAGDSDSGPAKTFRAIGISVTDAAGKLRKADDVMIDLAGKFANMDDGAKKTALAMEVFGKSGANLIPLLNGGAEGLREAADEARRFGLVLDEEAGKRAEEFNDNLTRFKAQAQGVAMAVGNELVPELNKLIAGFAKGGDLRDSPFIHGLHSVQAELIRMAMLADKAGGTMTTTMFYITGGKFTETGRWWKEQNDLYRQRYEENEKSLQALANLESGLDADGNPIKPKTKPQGNKGKSDIVVPTVSTKEAKAKVDDFSKWMSEQANMGPFTEEMLNARNIMSYDQQEALNRNIWERRNALTEEATAADEAAIALQALYDEMADIYELTVQEMANAGGFEKGFDEITAHWKNTAKNIEEVGMITALELQATFSDFFFDVMQGEMKDLEDYFKAFANAMQKAAADALSKELVANGSDWIKTGASAIMGMIGGVGSSPPTGATPGADGVSLSSAGYEWQPDGFRAGGGPVVAGNSYIVGEKRAELFTPGASGFITPYVPPTGNTYNSVSVPVTVEGNNKMASELRSEIEQTVERVIRRHS